MGDFFYVLQEGKGPTLDDHLNALDMYVKAPIELAFNSLKENIDGSISECESEAINQSLCTISAALITWGLIDERIMADLQRARL